MPAVTSYPSTPKRKRAAVKHVPHCPLCRVDLPPGAHSEGPQRCVSCGSSYQAVFFAPVVDPVIIPVAAQGTAVPCARHVRNAAEVSCQRCGAFMCTLCRIDSDGMSLCPACFDRLSSEGALPSARNSYRDYGRLALHATFLGILFWPVGPIVGPFAIITAIKGLKALALPGVRISKTRCVIAIILGALEIVFSVIIILVMMHSWHPLKAI
jgi:hypothetical protein